MAQVVGARDVFRIVHVDLLHGINSHHIAEAVFKAVARSLRLAVEADPRMAGSIPSTKGTLQG